MPKLIWASRARKSSTGTAWETWPRACLKQKRATITYTQKTIRMMHEICSTGCPVIRCMFFELPPISLLKKLLFWNFAWIIRDQIASLQYNMNLIGQCIGAWQYFKQCIKLKLFSGSYSKYKWKNKYFNVQKYGGGSQVIFARPQIKIKDLYLKYIEYFVFIMINGPWIPIFTFIGTTFVFMAWFLWNNACIHLIHTCFYVQSLKTFRPNIKSPQISEFQVRVSVFWLVWKNN